MKYYLLSKYDGNKYNAGSKALLDIYSILEKKGYKAIVLNKKGGRNSCKKFLFHLLNVITILVKIRKKDTVFINYPNWTLDFKGRILNRIIVMLSSHVQILVHDLNSIRFGNPFDEDIKLLNKAELLIVLTPSMRSFLEKHGVSNKMVLINVFDYLSEEENIPVLDEKSIVFAGNLEKSGFLLPLSKTNFKSLHFDVYGLGFPESMEWGTITYNGVFSPDKISQIKGTWGLVWDGDSIDSCAGPLGEYLMLNTPHKTALYIAAQKPVIVWNQSAIKDYIEDNYLGISIGSITELESKLDSLTPETKERIKEHVKIYSQKIRRGETLSTLLDEHEKSQ